MGSWGAKLYQNDDALDVRDQFKDLLRRGKTSAEITEELIEAFGDVLDNPYIGPNFWFALADTQWGLGRLQPRVKKQALAWLDKGGDLEIWKVENPKEAVVRGKVLQELRVKINSPQPPEKKISQYRLYQCEWNFGDVFAYQMESDLAKEEGFYGRYFLIQKVDEDIWHPGHVVPIVRAKFTLDDTLPTCTNEFDKLEYIQISAWCTDEVRRKKVEGVEIDERRFFPPIRKEAWMETDEYGFLPTFKFKMLNTSKRTIPSKLVFVGNFPNAVPPKIEYVPDDKISLGAFDWKNSHNAVETRLIKNYFYYNLRQGSVYTEAELKS